MTMEAGRFANLPSWRWTNVPPGYFLRWPHSGFDLLQKADWLPYGLAWLVRCNAHNTTKPADTAATGDQLGTITGRRGWCDQCAALGPTS